jgi:hypothetical protein
MKVPAIVGERNRMPSWQRPFTRRTYAAEISLKYFSRAGERDVIA